MKCGLSSPPMPATLTGALVTAILQQRGIAPRDFVQESSAAEIGNRFPLLGQPGQPGFRVLGPIFRAEVQQNTMEWFFPAPAHWFASSFGTGKAAGQMEVHQAQVPTDNFQRLGICGSVSKPVWVLNPPRADLKSLAGRWVNQAALAAVKNSPASIAFSSSLKDIISGAPAIIPLEALFENELRVGIALENGTRRARKGHLYSATQIRLSPGVHLAIGIDADLIPTHLDKEGMLVLGGEQRMVHYQQISQVPVMPQGESPWVMALVPQPYAVLEELQWADLPRASGPLLRMGGWDMKEGFHKDMVAYLPAGTVIKVPSGTAIPFGFIRL